MHLYVQYNGAGYVTGATSTPFNYWPLPHVLSSLYMYIAHPIENNNVKRYLSKIQCIIVHTPSSPLMPLHLRHIHISLLLPLLLVLPPK